MKKIKFVCLTALCSMLIFVSNIFAGGPACISMTVSSLTYNQDFDTLADTGTSSILPTGILFSESGTNSDTTYTAGTGSLATGDTYSFGTDSDRAFGGLQSGTLIPTIGACFTNNTGATISQFSVTYDGEQWRLGTASRTDRLDFQYSTDATSLTSGTWTDVDALDFTTPNTVTTGLKNGNLPENRIAGITSTITGLSISTGATFYIRYTDFNASGADDGLAIDNLSLTVSTLTAASGTVAGRVRDAKGNGLKFVTVMITGGGLDEPLYATTNQFGKYLFEDIPVGENYVLQVFSRRHSFEQSSRIVSLKDFIEDADFIGRERF